MDNKVFAVYMAISFLNGVLNFVVLPSSLYYVTYFGCPKVFVGLLLCMVPAGLCVSSPIIGKLADRVVDGDTILLASMIGHIIGNLVYSIPLSICCPLIGRLIIGIASSSQGVMFGQTYRKSALRNIPQRFLMMSSMNSIGFSAGPMIGGLFQFRLRIFSWDVNPGNSATLAMALVCLLIACVMTVCFRYETNFMVRNEEETDTEASLFLDVPEERVEITKEQVHWPSLCSLLYATFVITSMTTCSGVCVQFLAKKLFHLSVISINTVFANAFCFLIATYIIIYIVTELHSNRFIYGLLFVLQLISPFMLALVSFLGDSLPFLGALLLLPVINVGMAAQVSCPLCRSLITKIVNPRDTTFYQSVFTTILNMAYMTADVCAGMILDDAPLSFAVLGCILIILYVIGIVWYYKYSYNKHLA